VACRQSGMATLSLRQWCRLLILASFYGLSKLERAVSNALCGASEMSFQ